MVGTNGAYSMESEGVLTFWFHRVRGIPWLSEKILASQERLCSVS
jgi:hypothetical protein